MAQSFRSLHDPETLRMLIENLPAGVYITTRSGEVLDANRACLEILGVSSLEELRRIKVHDLYADPTQREKEVNQLNRLGLVRDFEIQIRRPVDGTVRTVLDTCYGVKDFDTGEVFYHGILVDITQRKHLEEQLRKLKA